MAIALTNAEYHLIFNPNAILNCDTINNALSHMGQDEKLALAAPLGIDRNGEPQFWAKRFSSPIDLTLRLMNISILNRLFKRKLDDYEYGDQSPAQDSFDIELASGCFMFCRTAALRAVGGFPKDYFMYFEDFDLSIKLRQCYKVKHFHDIRNTHFAW